LRDMRKGRGGEPEQRMRGEGGWRWRQRRGTAGDAAEDVVVVAWGTDLLKAELAGDELARVRLDAELPPPPPPCAPRAQPHRRAASGAAPLPPRCAGVARRLGKPWLHLPRRGDSVWLANRLVEFCGRPTS
jgi:hypothetical protein